MIIRLRFFKIPKRSLIFKKYFPICELQTEFTVTNYFTNTSTKSFKKVLNFSMESLHTTFPPTDKQLKEKRYKNVGQENER